MLADTVKAYGGILGAAVCCSDKGGLAEDDWTTCNKDRGKLLDRIFELAKARDLLLDFHVDENGNEESKGLRDIALKTIEHGYEGRVVCGHCWCATGHPPSRAEPRALQVHSWPRRCKRSCCLSMRSNASACSQAWCGAARWRSSRRRIWRQRWRR
jgi:hypothetical protein